MNKTKSPIARLGWAISLVILGLALLNPSCFLAEDGQFYSDDD